MLTCDWLAKRGRERVNTDMNLKKRLCLVVTLMVGVSLVWLHSALLSFLQIERRPLQRNLDSKWENCILPTDVHNLCNASDRLETPMPSCPLEALSQNCVLLAELHGYSDKPVDPEEKDFPLAFGIKIHTAPEQAEQLLRAIYRPHNVYCIHVDKRADDSVFRVMTSLAACFSNVILTDRISFVYRSYDAIRSELRTMACALASGIQWKYYLNLAGQEFPLRTNLEMVRILKLLNGTNDIESFPTPRNNLHRFSHKYKIVNGSLKKTSEAKGEPPFKASIRKGTQYSAFTRAFVTSLFYDEAIKSVMDFFRDAISPDENIWATINQLPCIPGGFPGHVIHTPNNEHVSRAVAWEKSDSYKCRGKYVRAVCIFTRADLPWLLQQPNLFANKFHLDMDSQVVACLEALVDQRVRSRALNINQSYYENLPHFKFRRSGEVLSKDCLT